MINSIISWIQTHLFLCLFFRIDSIIFGWQRGWSMWITFWEQKFSPTVLLSIYLVFLPISAIIYKKTDRQVVRVDRRALKMDKRMDERVLRVDKRILQTLWVVEWVLWVTRRVLQALQVTYGFCDNNYPEVMFSLM